MKKMVVLILVCLLAFGGVSFAEGFDLSAMSLEDLVTLHKQVDLEIEARIGCEKSLIPAGIYVVGESIKTGKYTIYTDEEHYGFNVATFESLAKYQQAMAEQNEALALFQIYVSSNDSTFVNLKDGMVLLVSETALIEVAKEAWVP